MLMIACRCATRDFWVRPGVTIARAEGTALTTTSPANTSAACACS
jgi:hypothetical protein